MGVNFLGFNDVTLSVVGGVHVAAAMRLWRFRQSRGFVVSVSEVAHRGSVCVCVFIGISVRAL